MNTYIDRPDTGPFHLHALTDRLEDVARDYRVNLLVRPQLLRREVDSPLLELDTAPRVVMKQL